MKKIITREMVREGYEKGVIKVVDNAEYLGCDSICCQIDDCAFYFDTLNTDNFETAEDYIKNTGIDGTIDAIYETLTDCIKEEFEDEYEYYYLVLQIHGIGNAA